MARCVEKSGKTVDEAVFAALTELKTVREKVNVVVLEEGSKGLFGLIGSKEARVRVEIIETLLDRAQEFVNQVVDKMEISVETETEETDESIKIILKGKDVGVLIGRRGETLDALQYLTSLVVNKGEEKYRKVIVDTENYRDKREETLRRLASRLADKVIKQKKSITLEPMNPYERRVIHSTLQNNKQVETFSVGEEPNRKIVIKLKQAAGVREQSASSQSRTSTDTPRRYNPTARRDGDYKSSYNKYRGYNKANRSSSVEEYTAKNSESAGYSDIDAE